MTKRTLTEDDVARLLDDPSTEHRVDTALKMAQGFNEENLSDSEREMAEDIFRLMIKDAEVRVREALAQTLKENPTVPHDIALKLANDVVSVALPMLQFSEVLSDTDLLEIVKSQDVSRQVAIAGRKQVSETVSAVLVNTQNEEVVLNLIGNDGADISEQDLGKVVEVFGGNESIGNAMVQRPKLPVTIAERLVTLVSENMRVELAKRHDLGDNLAADLILQIRERAIIGLSEEGDEEDLELLIKQLHENGRLTPTIILRALCLGDLEFFEGAIAKLSSVPLRNVRTLIHDPGKLGLSAVFKQAGLPTNYFPAARAAIDVAAETEYDGGENDRQRYSRRMIERILTQYEHFGIEFESDDINYLLTKMDSLPPGTLDRSLWTA